MKPDAMAWQKGQDLPALTLPPVTRLQLIKYAGASGDFNPIHTIDEAAEQAGLPGVIAHGMLTMAVAIRVVTDWVGDPGALVEYGVRFTRPVVVPDDDKGAVVEVSGAVAEKLADSQVRVELTATSDGKTVLGKAFAVVRLA